MIITRNMTERKLPFLIIFKASIAKFVAFPCGNPVFHQDEIVTIKTVYSIILQTLHKALSLPDNIVLNKVER